MEAEQQRTDFYKEISRNKLKSWILAALVVIVLFGLIWVFSNALGYGTGFLFIGGVFTIVYALVTYYYGDSIVLSSTGARPVNENNVKELQFKNVVENLAFAARLPVAPKTFVMESDEINAFATGRDPNHASVAITTGALNKLKRDEIEGVVAHELSHVSNYDVRYKTIIAVMVGLIAIMSSMFLRMQWFRGGNDRKGGAAIFLIIGIILAIIAPILVRIIQASISRKRESLADASGARLTRYPEGLASALEKIKNNNQGNMKVSEAVSHLFTVDPTTSALDNLFATHPPIEERIKTLRAM